MRAFAVDVRLTKPVDGIGIEGPNCPLMERVLLNLPPCDQWLRLPKLVASIAHSH